MAVLNSDGVRDALEEAAMDIEAKAVAGAPYETGTYQDSIDSTVEKGDDRWVGYVYADADHASVVEARTGNLLRAAFGGDA